MTKIITYAITLVLLNPDISSVANLTSLRKVAFHWLTSEYMQLARGFMQQAVAGGRRNIVHFHCHLRQNVNSTLEWG